MTYTDENAVEVADETPMNAAQLREMLYRGGADKLAAHIGAMTVCVVIKHKDTGLYIADNGMTYDIFKSAYIECPISKIKTDVEDLIEMFEVQNVKVPNFPSYEWEVAFI